MAGEGEGREDKAPLQGAQQRPSRRAGSLLRSPNDSTLAPRQQRRPAAEPWPQPHLRSAMATELKASSDQGSSPGANRRASRLSGRRAAKVKGGARRARKSRSVGRAGACG